MNQRLKDLFVTHFDVSESAVPDNPIAGEFEPWDSLGHLGLMMALEAEFDVRIPMEKMITLTSATAIEEFLRSQGVAGID